MSLKIHINNKGCNEVINCDIFGKYKFEMNSLNDKIIIENIKHDEIIIEIKTNFDTYLKIKNQKTIIFGDKKNIILPYGKSILRPIELNKDKNKIKIILKKDSNNRFPYLFHKYILNISNPYEPITYLHIDKPDKTMSSEYYLHIHCYDLFKLKEYFDKIIINYNQLFNIIITYSIGSINTNDITYKNIIWLKINNKGADIGGKICAINYLLTNNIKYKFVLFIHSKTDSIDRENFIAPFETRPELIINLMESTNPRLDAIFPNYHNIVYNIKTKTNAHTIKYNYRYLNDFFNYLGIKYEPNKLNWFNGTNIFIFSKKMIDLVFGTDNIFILYNVLNQDNSFDFEWYRKKYNIKDKDLNTVYSHYKSNSNIGNHFADKTKSIPNCCIEHMFERTWINILKYYGLNYLCLPKERICDYFNIKIRAIYFPQYHNSVENNKFWGEGFTEWTLLKPFADNINIRGNNIPILKPHPDIGYYSLDNINTFKSQCEMAKSYGLDGFVIYHYWFGNSHSVLNKVEEHILSGEIDFKFCFSWANEPWTKRWDGLNNDTLIEQNYEDENDFTHIEYLVKFFLMPNYIKNSEGECLFYIYNFSHIKEHFERIKIKWNKYLLKYNLVIQFISTENALPSNKKYGTDIRFDFLPMSLTRNWKSYLNSQCDLDNYVNGKISQHWELDYDDIIDYISKIDLSTKHIGISGRWNNIVRRQGIGGHLHIINYTLEKFNKLLMKLIVQVILKQINKFESVDILKYNVKKIDNINSNIKIDDHVFIINAWNEWNEQAVIEPSNIDEYFSLKIIKYFIDL